MTTPEPIWKVDAQLGEGPAWFADEGALRFVDIKGGRLHSYHPESRRRETLEIGGRPSFVVPKAGGGLLIGSGDGIYPLEGGQLGKALVTIPQPRHNRTNDGTVDGLGRLWFGTMDDEETHPTGAVWCLDGGKPHCAGGNAVITNGPAVNGEGSLLYHVDSTERTIWRFPIGKEPVLKQGEIFVRLTNEEGIPDGVVVDSEDCLWVALWDGWGVRRYAPDGTLLLHVEFPCARVTKLAFGGPELTTAYVTTARTGLDEATLADQPLAGSLFAFDAPVAGRPLPSVRLC
jgi:D-xylonolactonase